VNDFLPFPHYLSFFHHFILFMALSLPLLSPYLYPVPSSSLSVILIHPSYRIHLKIMKVLCNINGDRAVAQAVGHRYITTEARVCAHFLLLILVPRLYNHSSVWVSLHSSGNSGGDIILYGSPPSSPLLSP
jgi:hypothetical protein